MVLVLFLIHIKYKLKLLFLKALCQIALVDNKFDKEPLFEIEYLFLYFNIIDEKYQKNVLTKYRINYKIKASEEIYKAISGEIPARVYSNKHGVTIHLWNSYLLCFLLY